MSGMELAAGRVKIRPDIPIILCSGYSAMVSEENFKEKGIRKFCMKPMMHGAICACSKRSFGWEE